MYIISILKKLNKKYLAGNVKKTSIEVPIKVNLTPGEFIDILWNVKKEGGKQNVCKINIGRTKYKTSCRKCGADVLDSDKYCPKCGDSFEEKGIKCPKCSKNNEKSAKFCTKCGHKFASKKKSEKKK